MLLKKENSAKIVDKDLAKDFVQGPVKKVEDDDQKPTLWDIAKGVAKVGIGIFAAKTVLDIYSDIVIKTADEAESTVKKIQKRFF